MYVCKQAPQRNSESSEDNNGTYSGSNSSSTELFSIVELQNIFVSLLETLIAFHDVNVSEATHSLCMYVCMCVNVCINERNICRIIHVCLLHFL